jgi:hypothetical protein
MGAIASSFAASSEFKTRYGSLGNSAFVTQIYENVFGRAPDTSGLSYWTGQLAHGESRGNVMVAFSESSEGVRRMAPQVDTILVGLGMFRAVPPSAEFSTGVALIADGDPVEALARYLESTPTYAARFG